MAVPLIYRAVAYPDPGHICNPVSGSMRQAADWHIHDSSFTSRYDYTMIFAGMKGSGYK